VDTRAEDISDTVRNLVDAGTRTVKMFTTYRGETMAEESTILRVMAALQPFGGMAVVHCENDAMIGHEQDAAEAAARISAGFHDLTRPVEAENAAVATLLQMARQLGTPVYFVHQSTAGAVELTRTARAAGVRAYSEVVAHHLALSDRVYRGPDPEGYVCCPPMRSEAERLELRRAVAAGAVDVLASDHCCYSLEQKRSAQHDVRSMPNGLPGVETRLTVLLDELVTSGVLTPVEFFRMVATNPAKLNGLFPRKGAIRVGADADLVIWDPDARATITSGELHMATDYTPYEGRAIRNAPRTVFVRGVTVLDNGTLTDAPAGEFQDSRDLVLW
jgi:dihydropyrimidinase